MDSLNFEWDENKNTLNQKKHGVSFEEAKTIFIDELARLIPDPDNSKGEERFILMGISAKYNFNSLSLRKRLEHYTYNYSTKS